MNMDKLFLRDEKRIKRLYDTELLAHLLLLNYQFLNNKYHNINASEIFKNLHRVKYSKKYLEQIKNNAIVLLDIKYNKSDERVFNIPFIVIIVVYLLYMMMGVIIKYLSGI